MSDGKRAITAEDLYRIVVVEDPRISPDGSFVAWVRQQAQEFSNDYRREIWLSPRAGGAAIQLTRGGKDSCPRWSPDGRTLAFLSARCGPAQLYLLPLDAPGGEARQLTNLPRAVSQPVWSPDGSRIAFLAPVNAGEREREDRDETLPAPEDALAARHREERQALEETLRHDPRVINAIPYREGTTWRDGRHAQLYVIATAETPGETPAPRRLTHVAADYSAPSWSADGRSLLCIRSAYPERPEPRRQASLYRIDLADGAEQRLTGDEVSCEGALAAPRGDQVAFLHRSVDRYAERLTRLALVSAAGGAVRELTGAFDREVDAGSLRWSADGRWLYFSAGSEGARGIWRLRPGAPAAQVLTGELEVTGHDLAADGGIAAALSSAADPSALHWLDAAAAAPRALAQPNADFLKEVCVQPVHEQRFRSPDGQALQGWLMLPPDHAPGMRHPLALNIHGGPHAMWGPAAQSMWHEWQLHAARGYAVFFCNPRGSDGYGEAFRMALHQAWGEVALRDILAGVDHVLAGGQIDPERLAITGGSYGGYMTAWIIGHSDRFRAAVAQRGVYNLVSFFGVTDIPLFLNDEFDATPAQDADLLWRHSPLAHAANIRTPLLILHSENDFRVPISDAEQLFALIKLQGGEVAFVRYPRDGHELSRSGEPRHRVDRLQRTLAWFDRYCLQGS